MSWWLSALAFFRRKERVSLTHDETQQLNLAGWDFWDLHLREYLAADVFFGCKLYVVCVGKDKGCGRLWIRKVKEVFRLWTSEEDHKRRFFMLDKIQDSTGLRPVGRLIAEGRGDGFWLSTPP